MNTETKQVLKDKIDELNKKINSAQIIEDEAKIVYESRKASRISIQNEKDKIKEDFLSNQKEQ